MNPENKTIPRGIRNNNPANIRSADVNAWRGQNGKDDDGFCIFTNPVMGIRAVSIIIRGYIEKHGCNTISKIISRFAPPSENDTDSYINAVCSYMIMHADREVDLDRDLAGLLYAIINHENGYCPYSMETISGAASKTLSLQSNTTTQEEK